MMMFSELTSDLQAQLKRDLAQIRFMLKKNQGMAYARIVEIGKEVGKKIQYQTNSKLSKRGKN